ncbi:hypothetical protein [Virgisporangium ochraceum]|uniref:Uncharacterized protein n=1 Tax=Virgisporangium ochraceum TaxID=65505 RepID=A0A8J4EA65_9ACTN|nr:hypothetical protein [Virgisporangium ochraceum]GIJ67194.1 hypothetical protein Voc01_021110 [Virgisporangium ochraceum]
MHRPLVTLAGVMAGLAVFSLVGTVVDDRTVLGVNTWLKPLKFGVSFALYAVTMAWLIGRLTRARRTAWWAGTVIAVFGFLEVALIAFQAARARMSHFNATTDLDDRVFTAMGVTIAFFYAATLVVVVLLMIQRPGDRALTWALRLGLVIAVVGMALGFLMLVPTEAQVAADTGVIGAHSVGVEDGGPGLPVTGWSTTGGDLRIPHFVGMHALQVLPLLLLALKRFDEVTRLRLVVVAAAGYVAVLALVTWQALRGQPLVHPDAATLVVAGLVAAGTAVGVLVAVGGPREHSLRA